MKVWYLNRKMLPEFSMMNMLNGKDFLHVLYHPVSLSMMEQLYLADLLVIKKGLISAAKGQGKLKLEKEKANGRGCMAMILVKREKLGKWVVTKFMREHNHPLVISSKKGRSTTDEKDERIRELSSQLHHTNRQLAARRDQLQTFMTYIEEHTMCMLRTLEGVVQNIREVESETRSCS